jgi:hopene-associated glycosyltransferase HpnB
MLTLVTLSLILGATVLLLPWRPWSTTETLDATPAPGSDLSDITVLIPARNEAGTIGQTLRALHDQGRNLAIVLVDDQSDDGTAAVARAAGTDHLQIISGEPLPAGWSGKLWALEQGRRRVATPLILLLDADILLRPGLVATLRAKSRRDGLQLVSLMAHLGMTGFWEKLLLPAFVYFFKLIYPFALANSASGRVAAAAGGCILIDTAWLERIGGFAALKTALIDDCTLARQIKDAGGRTWLGLTHSAISLRRYDLTAIWNMVARTAFTQLRYSVTLLLVCTALLVIYYLVPVIALAGDGWKQWALAFAAYLCGCLPYAPTLAYYRLHPLMAMSMPVIAILYLMMTWTSALRYFAGERSRWKGRSYTKNVT